MFFSLLVFCLIENVLCLYIDTPTTHEPKWNDVVLLQYVIIAYLLQLDIAYSYTTCPTGEVLALSLFMLGILGTNNHNFAVTFDNLALVAHGFY